MTKAYSYIRFSTPEQLKGNSLQRQLEASKKYCEEHGLTLDTSLNLRDLGLSAYHGTHRTKGDLGIFLDLVKTPGKIEKGSVLIVENLDRLSRRHPMEAFAQFTLIIEAGIKLVTLTDMQEYTKESIKNNQGQLWMSLGTMMRAYQESDLKSKRLKSAWQSKRKNEKIVTAKCPYWLKVVKDGQGKRFETREEVVKAIRRIFELKLQGIGEERIALELNNDHNFWQPPQNKRNKTGGWRKSYIAKILRNRAVIGEYTHHQLVLIEEGEEPKMDQRYKNKEKLLRSTRQKVSDPIPNYYPPIIDEKTFNRTKYQIEERLKQNGFAGGKTGKAYNLFAHLVRCGLCGGPMHYIDKGAPPKGGQYLHCDHSRRKLGCDAKPIRYDEFQDIFFNDLKELDLSKFNPDDEGSEKEIDSIQASIEDYKQRLSDVGKMISNTTQGVAGTDDKGVQGTLLRMLSDLKRTESELEKQIEDLEHNLRALLADSHNQRKKLDLVKEVKQLLDKAKDEDQRINLRLRIRAELQRLIHHILIYPYGTLTIDQNVLKEVDTEFNENLIAISEAAKSLLQENPNNEYLKSLLDDVKSHQETKRRGSKALSLKAPAVDKPNELIFYRYKSRHLQGVSIHFRGIEKVRNLAIFDASDGQDSGGNENKPIILGL